MADDLGQVTLSLELALTAGDQPAIIECLRRLEGLGERQTYASVAAIYETGLDNIRQNLGRAFDWYAKSADEEGDPVGHFGLARFYLDGRFVKQDLQKAVEYLRIAHCAGSMEATLILSRCYMQGKGVPKDFREAEALLIPAAAQGYVLAYAMLSKIERSRLRYWKALKLWWQAVDAGRRLTLSNPKAPQLYGLNGAWNASK
jgi:TPR repeat protein